MNYKRTANQVRKSSKIISIAAAGAFASGMGMVALHAETPGSVDNATLREVMKRLDAQAEELKALKAQIASTPSATTPGATMASSGGNINLQQRLEKQDSVINDLKEQLSEVSAANTKPKYPNISFHGFGDINYSADSRKGNQIPYGQGSYGGKNTFYLGELDIFLNAQLAENISFLSENVLSVGSDNDSGVDIERLILQYRQNDYFNIDLGRFHTALGYYNTTYHHGSWLQNTVGRPTFLQFEDSGGIMPVHMVGISVHGEIPSGSLNLNYYLEAGNGENFTDDGSQNAVQQLVSNSDSKAVNFALVAKPDWLSGLQFGAGVYYDMVTPVITNTAPAAQVGRNSQFIFNSHIVYHTALWELIAEGYLINDRPAGKSSGYTSPAFFVQASRKLGDFTPYARYTYYDISKQDTLYTTAWAGGVNAGVHAGPSVGLRYDLSSFVALKAQYDYLMDDGLNNASRIQVQASFTF